MSCRTQIGFGFMLAVTLAMSASVSARKTPPPPTPTDLTVEFGQNQFPQDPAPANHILDPDEVTIAKGGTVTFEINGGAHGIGIYPVNIETTRADIEAGLCQPDPATCSPQGATTSNLEYFVYDHSGDLIIDTGINPPTLRVDDPTLRLVWAGGPVYLTGRTAAGTAAQQIQYRFEKVGRYLVICMDRNHFINDRMFGFVNVVKR
jgi:plastocyanin